MALSRLVWCTGRRLWRARLALPLFLAAMALTASAQVFVVYPFSADVNPSAIGAGVTPTLGLATLSNAFIGDDGFGNVLEAYPTTGSTSAALALANNSFFTLSLSIAPGTFGPTTVNFNVGKGGSSDPRGFLVRSSLDGFASNVLTQTLPSGANQIPAPQSFSLNLAGQSSVTIRFYVWTPGLANSVDFRNLQVAGSLTATPLPPSFSFALIGLAATSLYWAWRRRTGLGR